MEDLWSASGSPREGFDDGTYANEVMTGLDDGKRILYSLALTMKHALLFRFQ